MPGREVNEGDVITIDGASGEVMIGEVPTVQPELAGDFGTLMEWADGVRRLKVRANAETPLDARTAREFGAEGIGLCRTEHMFFDAARITAVRQMILAEDEKGRRAALDKLLPEQRSDFVEIFEVMAGLPVTIRLLDPPLHEFLPHEEEEFAEVAAAAGVEVEYLKRRAAELHEFNPMLGHRGCRLGVTYPEIYEMQARAIFEAAVQPRIVAPVPEMMIPLVATRRELELMKAVVDKAARGRVRRNRQARRISRRHDDRTAPRRFARRRDRRGRRVLLVRHQRPDADRARGQPRRRRAVPADLCRKGHLREGPVRQHRRRGRRRTDRDRRRARAQDARPASSSASAASMAATPPRSRSARRSGLDYVSASPYRVPIARLAAAQAALAKA